MRRAPKGRALTARGTARLARKRAAERRGRLAELAAVVLLTLKGYRLVARRVRTPVGEIDLIVRRGRTLAFVEVKMRGGSEAAEALGARQRGRIARAAAWWLARRPAFGDHVARFDAVLVSPRRLPRHLEAAFEA